MPIIDGKSLADSIRNSIKKEIEALGIKPCLATILVGDNEASKIYIKNKHNACKEVGIKSKDIRLNANIDEKELENVIRELNEDSSIDGILLQLPLPKNFDKNKFLSLISPSKDVDGFHFINAGKLFLGQNPLFKPCTPKGIIRLIESVSPVEGKNACVIGRSNIVGKPTAIMLLEKNATVTVCHSKTRSLAEFTKNADIVVVAVGKPKLLRAEMVKENAIVIDVGINRVNGRLCGDADFEEIVNKAYITPVPGGVGPMTIAMLLENVLIAAKRRSLHD